MYTYDIYAVSGGYGYRIFVDGKCFIDQPCLPCVPGNILMNSAKATALALLLVDRMNDAPTGDEQASLASYSARVLGGESLTDAEQRIAMAIAQKGSCVLSLTDVMG